VRLHPLDGGRLPLEAAGEALELSAADPLKIVLDQS